MKKIIITVGLFCLMAGKSLGQESQSQTDSDFVKRKLKIEEINLVEGYYHQNGNNSAITGGVGSELLHDFENSLDIVLSKEDRYGRKHTISLDANIDFYTSASSDKIDSLTVGSASRDDWHFYPSISWSVNNPQTRITQSFSYSFSREFDYKSNGITAGLTFLSKDGNRDLNLRASAFLDTYMAILPAELRPITYPSGAKTDRNGISYKARNSFAFAASLSQVVTPSFQFLVMVEPSYQEGFLSTPFHRVYFSNGDVTTEKLPGQRLKLPIGFRSSLFLGDKLVLRGFYRFYYDTWGMLAHTASLEVPYKFTPFLSISPFVRYNIQGKVNYFRPKGYHDISQEFYTSDYDLSTFDSWFLGTGLRMSPPGGIMGIQHINSLEMRYGYYTRSNGLQSHSITLAFKFK